MKDQRIESHKATVYRTQHFTDEQVKYMSEQANRQEKIIGRIFFKQPSLQIGPTRLHEREGFNWPITSTRRTITNLTSAGILEMLEKTEESIYGKSEHLWTWKKPAKMPGVQSDMFGAPETKSSAYDL